MAALPPRRGTRCRHDQRSRCCILLLVLDMGTAQDRFDSARPRDVKALLRRLKRGELDEQNRVDLERISFWMVDSFKK